MDAFMLRLARLASVQQTAEAWAAASFSRYESGSRLERTGQHCKAIKNRRYDGLRKRD